MFHGFTGSKIEAHRFFVKLARSLSDSGFIILRFDFRCSGDSDGEFEDITLPRGVDTLHG
jgi:alpha/beta superfamily hydrolase